MPSIAEIAKEMNVDISTLDPKFVSKLDQHYSDASTQLSTAQQLRQQAEANLQRVQQENDEIQAAIIKHGETDALVAALKANNAAMEAQLKSLQEQGFEVKIPESTRIPVTSSSSSTHIGDPDYRSAISNLSNATTDLFWANNQHMLLHGSPIPGDPNQLWEEARRNRVPFRQYVAQKYDFAGAETRKREADAKKHDDEIAAAAVKKYQEEHPQVEQHPMLRPGMDSRNGTIFKPVEPGDVKKMANMTMTQKIAASRARTLEVARANQQ